MSKNLILYYSQKLSKGNTAYVATYIQEAIGGDLFPIETVDAYPNDYMACIDQAKKEMNAHARPALVHYIDDISDYDNIFICGPCWWGLFPMPIYSQLERLDFTNKNVYVVVTHEGSGMGNCERIERCHVWSWLSYSWCRCPKECQSSKNMGKKFIGGKDYGI